MSFLTKIKDIVFGFFDFFYEKKLRKQLKTNEFSLITSNCMAGWIYHRLGVEFQSPTINQFMSDKDFFKFIFNLDYYLNVELKENGTDGKYPLGILGDIPIEFTHYSSAQEAISAWERRKKRLNPEKMYFILFDTIDGEISKEDIIKFGTIKCANKIVLSTKSYPDIDYVKTIPIRKKDINRHYMNRNIFGRRRFEGKWDFVKWINDGITKTNI